jgi:hypothetical protein
MRSDPEISNRPRRLREATDTASPLTEDAGIDNRKISTHRFVLSVANTI